MNRIVRDHYPVAALPEDLRAGLPDNVSVRVTIEAEPSEGEDAHLSLDEVFALRQPPFATTESLVEEVRRQRDGWED